jgi:hypothetical protein
MLNIYPVNSAQLSIAGSSGVSGVIFFNFATSLVFSNGCAGRPGAPPLVA